MQPLRFLFSPAGRLRPRAFAVGVAALYAAGVASQWLTAQRVVAWGGLWPFVVAQSVLVWIWFSLHAKRLRDAGRGIGLAVGAGVLYALAIVLLLTLVAAFIDTSTAQASDPNATGALVFILFLWIVAVLSGSHSFDLLWVVVALLTAAAFLPILVALAVTLWAVTRPGVEERKA
jgi:hypothetical protein